MGGRSDTQPFDLHPSSLFGRIDAPPPSNIGLNNLVRAVMDLAGRTDARPELCQPVRDGVRSQSPDVDGVFFTRRFRFVFVCSFGPGPMSLFADGALLLWSFPHPLSKKKARGKGEKSQQHELFLVMD